MQAAVQQFLNSLKVERNASPLTIKSYLDDLSHLQEFLQEPKSLAGLEASVAEWVEASEQLDMLAFLSGYEMGELLRERV
jgi:site-specific recombinase XerD